MEKQRYEQKIFRKYHRTVEACGKCNGTGKVLVYPEDDVWKLQDPDEMVCPLCEGSGLLHKTVTVTTDLSPFKRE